MAGEKRKATASVENEQKNLDEDLSSATRMNSSRNMDLDAARQAVFNTVEILEHIMSFLPAKTVFAVQRVSRQFRNVLASSKRLQGKLFLRPIRDPSVSWVLQTPSNYLWRQWEDAQFRVQDKSSKVHSLGHLFTPSDLSPLLCISKPEQDSARRMLMEAGELVDFNVPITLGASSSWRNTFLSDPSCTSVDGYLSWISGDAARIKVEGRVQVADPGGLTLGAVVDTALHCRGEVSCEANGTYWDLQLNTTVDAVLKKAGYSEYAKIRLDHLSSFLTLKYTVIPSSEEWYAIA